MRYTFNFNSFLKQSNDDGSGIGVVRGTGRQCQHLISSSIFFVGCEYILIYVLCIFFYMSRQQSQTVRRRFPAVQPLDSSVPGQPGVRVLAGLWYCPPLPIVFSFVWVAPDFSNITLYDMLRYLSITTLFRVRQASHFPDEFLRIPALFTTSSVLLFVVCVNAALGSHIELLANCVMVGCSDMMSGSACSL